MDKTLINKTKQKYIYLPKSRVPFSIDVGSSDFISIKKFKSYKNFGIACKKINKITVNNVHI